jgi:hypothetical protein
MIASGDRDRDARSGRTRVPAARVLALVAWAALSEPGRAAPPDRARPSLREPGPDTPDFPDSAFTVPQGVTYVETALVGDRSKDADPVRSRTTPFLIRHGLAPRWELRISGDGATRLADSGSRTTGFSDVVLGVKRHFRPERGGRPALGLIAQIKAPSGSDAVGNGKVESFASLNFDKTLPGNWDLEWNIGASWLTDDAGGRFGQANLLWALGRELSPRWSIFTDGFAELPAAPGREDAVVAGAGARYMVSDRLGLDASYHAGLTSTSPDRLLRFGTQVTF